MITVYANIIEKFAAYMQIFIYYLKKTDLIYIRISKFTVITFVERNIETKVIRHNY